ncbi:MAG: amino acid adenylation domain-containing protein, partial [bacterium]|nr:amino acid adenylation domain-containing protein [bacterium]
KEQVEKNPDRTAVVGMDNFAVTYAQLDRDSDQAARLLMEKGAAPGDIVAIMMERSPDMIIGILGILKLGAAYLPIDPAYPQKRIDYMLADANPILCLRSGDLGNILPLSASSASLPAPGGEQPADDPAYVIYTSGSTGKPKGVMIPHSAAVNLISYQGEQFGMTDNERVLQFTTISFDPSVEQIFLALLNGAALVLLDKDTLLDMRKFEAFLVKQSITHFHSVPSFLSNLPMEETPYFNRVISGGDICPIPLAAKWSRNCDFYNKYGPTETTVVSVEFKVEAAGPVAPGLSRLPIGKPLGNTVVYIVDPWLQPLPPGAPGEMYIGGAGVALGYLNRPELTIGRFIPNPFSDSPSCPLLYRTGDFARWLPDGNLEFLGRTDHQVKIRGYRIELGEIETRVLEHRDVKEAKVIAPVGKNNRERYLAAYIVLHSPPGSDDSTISQIREYLSVRLPDYLVPAHFVVLERMPLSPGGKVDTKALPEPRFQAGTGEDRVAPSNAVEEKLAAIWAQVLGIEEDSFGINHNFFELGGHSLKATSLIYEIYRQMEVNLDIGEVFEYPTINELAPRVTAEKKQETREHSEAVPVAQKEYYPLSYAQRRLWVLCQFEEDSTAYNMPAAVTLGGHLDTHAFTNAVKTLADRHESLRTVFILVDGEPRQKIIDSCDFKIDMELIDLRNLAGEAKEEKVREIYIRNADTAFHLEKGPLFRFKLVRLEEKTHVLAYNIHHIVNDGWSQGIINNELMTLYNTFHSGGENPLPPLYLQYKDYSRWHNRLILEESFNQSKHYWLEKFKDKPNGIDLPLDHPRRPIQTFNGGRVVFSIPEEKTARLHRLSLDQDATLFMSMLTLLNIILYRYSGQEDIIIGSPIANRKRPELHHMVGFLVNTLIYRNTLNPGESFKQLLEKLKHEALNCYRYQDFPFDLLVEQLELERDLSQSPLFNVMLAHNNTDTADRRLEMEGVTIGPYTHRADFNMSKFDLIFFIDEHDDRIFTIIEYNSDLFDRGTIERMADNFRVLVDRVIEEGGAEMPVSTLEILSHEQYQTVIETFNHTRCDFPQITIQEMFQQQAESHRDSTAVVFNGEKLTYDELNKKANRFAHFLKEKYRVKPNHIIGVSLDRSLDMVVVLWGIIKAGAAYLAVDPTYPRERVLHVLANSRSDLLVVDKIRPELFDGYPGEIIDISTAERQEQVNRQSPQNPPVVNQPLDILYVNYTSGSTGTPNGAILSHDCLTNLVQWQSEKTVIDGSLRCLQFTSINFCVSFQEIMGTLTSGGELYLIGEIERQDVDYLMDYLGENQIENLYLPFSYLNFLFNESGRWDRSFKHNLKHIITAGEQLKVTAGLKRFLDLNPHIKLHNHYGSTEMHVVTSYTLDASAAGRVPIPPAGKPISNVKIYILDEHFNPVPMGVWGELCVAGKSEVLGYINDDELTGRKLLKHPSLSADGVKLYRSGDIGRWNQDGNIELRGRKDFLVKVRGFRVEPGEIESKILAIDRVRECVVVVREDRAGQKYLVAYVVADNMDTGGIKKSISKDLPQYMVPQLILLDSLPLMHNGKVDREKLPDPEGLIEKKDAYTAPTNPVEKKLTEIWAGLLGMEAHQVGIDDNFFELGGHSLKATTMMSKIHQKMDVKVELLDIFRAPTIREIAALIRETEAVEFSDLEKVEEREFYPLSYHQERLYILHRLNPQSPAYNMPERLVLTDAGDITKEMTEIVLRKLMQRHESLRTGFKTVDDRPVQFIAGTVELPFEFIDISTVEEAEKEQQRAAVFTRVAKVPFDLDGFPLFRAALIKLGPDRHEFIFNLHHIISDGWSMQILGREFHQLLAGCREGKPVELEPLQFQYKDFAHRHNRLLTGAGKKEDPAARYWMKKLADGIPTVRLPADFSTGTENNDRQGAGYRQVISSELKTELHKLADTYHTSLFTVMFSIYMMMLSRVSGQEDAGCSVIAAGREHASLQAIVGLFVNSILFSAHVDKDEPFADFLQRFNDSVIESFQYQGYPMEPVFEQLGMRYPEVTVSFNMLNMQD